MYQNCWNAEIEGNVLMPNGTFLTHTLQHVLASELTESLSFTSYTNTKLSTYPEQELKWCVHMLVDTTMSQPPRNKTLGIFMPWLRLPAIPSHQKEVAHKECSPP